jgi:signal transduction histidine kinase
MPDWRHGPLKSRAAWVIAATAAVVAACWCIRLCGLVNAVGNSLAEVPLLVLPFLAAYALGCETGLAVGAGTTGALIAAVQAANGAFTPLELMFTVGPWAAGRVMRSRRRLLEQLRASNNELQAQQEAYAAEVVRYERSRIAADLHDLVGHALSLMVVQAGAGQRAARDREDRARIALEHAGEAAREAQAEVRAVAGLLAGEAAAGVPGGLGLVAEVVRQARQAGIDVTYRLAGPGGSGNPEAESAAGRIVTEALTNALKHAPGARPGQRERARRPWQGRRGPWPGWPAAARRRSGRTAQRGTGRGGGLAGPRRVPGERWRPTRQPHLVTMGGTPVSVAPLRIPGQKTPSAARNGRRRSCARSRGRSSWGAPRTCGLR